jgi:hypothetical protein
MKGICKLYETTEILRESHVFPKFVIDYMKATGSKYLRNYSKPNRRYQDGPKVYLLSERAEQLFSVREKWFSERIFKKYLDKDYGNGLDYDENLFYFTVSILWRALLMNIEHPNVSKQSYIKTLHEVEEEWRLFLRDLKYPNTYNRFYLFFTDRVKSHNFGVEGVDYYMSRSLDATIADNENQTFLGVYVKFLRFVFWE